MKSSLRAAFFDGRRRDGRGKPGSRKGKKNDFLVGKVLTKILAGQRQSGILPVNRFLTCFPDLRGKRTGILL